MTITKLVNDSITTVSVEGRLDTVTSPEFDSEVSKLLEETSELVLDFKNLAYTSSAGLRVILKTQKAINAKGGNMKIINVNDEVMEVFDITGFLDILDVE